MSLPLWETPIMKRMLEIDIHKPGDLMSEVTNLDDVNAHGMATSSGNLKENDDVEI